MTQYHQCNCLSSHYQQNNLQSHINCNCQSSSCCCGTKISLDQQLINQRQQWKQKYFCLQKQTNKDIGLLKQKIYQECSLLMQNQFNRKQKQHTELINKKNIDIQQLTARIIKLESAYKVEEKQKQILQQKLTQQQHKFNQKLQQITQLKQKHTKLVDNIQEQNLSQTGLLRTRFVQQNQELSHKLTEQNNLLKLKIKQFQRKYLNIIPQVEKLKNMLNKKNEQIQILEQQLGKIKQSRQKQNQQWRIKLESANNIHMPCSSKIFKLNQKITELQNQLIKAKQIKKQVKVQPVYINRPVQVQRIVQKIIQVQRIVKQYIQPQIPISYKQYQQQNQKLRDQLNKIIYQLKIFQNKYTQLLNSHQLTVEELQSNIAKYKKERETLVKRINEQDEELEKIYNLMMIKETTNTQCTDNQKIVVMVNKDGTYNKRVEKIDITQKVNVTKNNIKAKETSIVSSKQPTLKDIVVNKTTKSTTVLKKK